eukprot:TRINITY_DN11036_c0_g1_i1.p1 TRINITY_DN11036_c0_g1~~TRINITY_DN11036_c0_g1_i1.p1  ORF type:complete len:317 (+),score=54.20 TRINITY_DN11036_c0_g1_i1:27-953(+)
MFNHPPRGHSNINASPKPNTQQTYSHVYHPINIYPVPYSQYYQYPANYQVMNQMSYRTYLETNQSYGVNVVNAVPGVYQQKRERSDMHVDMCDIEPEKKKVRNENSTTLIEIAQSFMSIMKASDGKVDLNKMSAELDVKKRRIYDVTGVLEGLNLIEKTSKNQYQFIGSSYPDYCDDTTLSQQEEMIDNEIIELQNSIAELLGTPESTEYCYVTPEDIKSHPQLNDQTVFAVHAPKGTHLSISTDNSSTYSCQLHLKNEINIPIEVYVANCPTEEEDTNQTPDPVLYDMDYTSFMGEQTFFDDVTNFF